MISGLSEKKSFVSNWNEVIRQKIIIEVELKCTIAIYVRYVNCEANIRNIFVLFLACISHLKIISDDTTDTLLNLC